MLRLRKPSAVWSACLALAAVLVWFGPALAQTMSAGPGQGFMVRPMRLEAIAPPGQTVEVPLQIRNIAGAGNLTVNLRLVELSQTLDGGWRLIEPGLEDTSGLLSSTEWTTLNVDSVTVAPMQPADVMARLNVPASARGVYFAGVVAETPQPENTSGITVRVRFLVPLIIHIQGRPVRQQVALEDILLTREAEPGTNPTTTAHLRIANRGRTFSRVRGSLRVERESDGVWRPVTTVEIPERGIIPGVTIELGDDLERRLPSGPYRLKGELYVDGRRVAPLQKDIDFDGDDDVSSLAFDTSLLLTPAVLDLDVAPGATRTTVVRIENPGTDPVNVTMQPAIPASLAAVEMGSIRGADYSSADWTEIRPSEFTIAPGRWQNVRVVTSVPDQGAIHPHYYADLILKGTYPDGQSAGETRSTVHLANREGESIVDGMVEQLQLAEGEEPSEYVVQMRLVNVGNVDILPTARALVLNPQGRAILGTTLTGDEGALLPLSKRTFSGDLTLAGLEPGYYALQASVALTPEEEVTRRVVLQVEHDPAASESGASPIITVLDPAVVELPEGVVLPAGDEGEGGDANAE